MPLPTGAEATMPRRRSIPLFFAFIASLAMLSVPPLASGADVSRGRALYELRCNGCHTESVHGRAKRVAADFEDVRRWVSRWNETLKLAWKDDEVDDVTVHLNTSYYGYSCPPRICKVVSLASGSPLIGRAPLR